MNWSSKDNIKIYYRLLGIKGVGCAQANKILWSLPPGIQSSESLEENIKSRLTTEQQLQFGRDYDFFNDCDEVGYLSVLDQEKYPTQLFDSLHQNAPTVLSFIGNRQLLKKRSVGFSGSRKVSEKGLWIARDCASQFAQNDVCVVSGYANGVDLQAHQEALAKGGCTIIVLPEGIGSFHIRKELKSVWDWERVLVISEFMPKDRWMATRAMRRNQTIIGLSDAMLVIEAGETGGSIDAGFKSIDLGKPLFVPKYREWPDSALGNVTLINRGAKQLMMSRFTQTTNLDAVNTVINSHRQPTQLQFL